MANDYVPFIAIIGGFWNLEPGKIDPAKRMAGEIGAALAKEGFTPMEFIPRNKRPDIIGKHIYLFIRSVCMSFH